MKKYLKKENIIYFIPETNNEETSKKWHVDVIFELKNKLNCKIFIYDDWIKDISKKSKEFRKYFENIFINGIKDSNSSSFWYEIISKNDLIDLFFYKYYPTDYILIFIKNQDIQMIKQKSTINERKDGLITFTSTPKNFDFALRLYEGINLSLAKELLCIIMEVSLNFRKNIGDVKIQLADQFKNWTGPKFWSRLK